MRLTYTGRQVELAPAQLHKIEAQVAKLGKLLDGKDEREAHVILSHERHLHRAEISVNYHNHPLVGIAEDLDMFTSIHSAIQKLEKQAIKVRAKWRDTKRTPRKTALEPETAAPQAEAANEAADGKRIFRINHHQHRKPMTLDEALLEMEKDRDYLVYRDADTDRLAVLVRRRDGHFDLVEC
jgi:putative sigma-54 modulation protein